LLYSSVVDPWRYGVDPDPAILVIDLQDASKNLIKKSLSVYYFLKVQYIYIIFLK
jgi:hypothetical protein